MAARIPPRIQGDLGEVSALQWLVSHGARVSIPLNSSPDYDLVADFGDGLLRVQVKTGTVRTPAGRWQVQVCTRGGNRSWSGLTKHFESARCDFLFAHVGDGRRWFIPSACVDAATAMHLGGPKYAEHEVESGAPLTTPRGASWLQCRAPAG